VASKRSIALLNGTLPKRDWYALPVISQTKPPIAWGFSQYPYGNPLAGKGGYRKNNPHIQAGKKNRRVT
jgi:hypothetical protein